VTLLIVTVDGPAGTGKSTVSRAVAARLGLPHLDTGAFYRAAGVAALRAGIADEDVDGLVDLIGSTSFDQVEGRMFLEGEDVSDEIRTAEATAASSRVSAHPEVRRLLVEHQRDWVLRHDQGAVVEGRDIGSVVFPDATVKVYLDARPEVRAGRRADQTGEDLASVVAEIEERDRRDTTREASPLTVPAGAIVVDTSDLTFDQVVDHVVELVETASG
jgi:cytidylate kinase